MEEHIQENTHFPAGKREIWMLIGVAISCILMADFVFYGGFNLGFAVTGIALSILSFRYLRKGGQKGGYMTALFVLEIVISASFMRSDDNFVKFVMVCFLLIAGNLNLTLTAGQNRRAPGKVTSLLDAPRAVFTFGLGGLGDAFGGLNDARKNAGEAGKKNFAVLAGLAAAVPVLAVLIPLLMKADAAFEGLIGLLPKMNVSEPLLALLFGIPMACVLYSRNTGLKHRSKEAPDPWTPRHFSSLTVNTVLGCVAAVYGAYLVSQLAYFVGGFSGILPEGFTMAEYARRGFFEMAWLAVINLGIIVLSAALTGPKDGKLPLSTRVLCLFIGAVTLFLAATASAKMFLYIGSFGLTRLRLLVQVIIIFIALTVIFVAIWLLRPKFSYMKAVLLTAMVMGAAVAWADVDTVVAAYNVGAYQSGQLETVDAAHLCQLGNGAVPYLQQLVDDGDPAISATARQELLQRYGNSGHDLRKWNIADALAQPVLAQYREEAEDDRLEQEKTENTLNNSPMLRLMDSQEVITGCQKLMAIYLDYPTHGAPLTVTVKDQLFFLSDGVLFTDQPYSADAAGLMEQVQISTIVCTDSYVAFCSDLEENTFLVYGSDPYRAADDLAASVGDLSWHQIGEFWVMMIG